MPTLKNVSPVGALDVPFLRRVIDRAEEFEVTEDQVRALVLQVENYLPVCDVAKRIFAELTHKDDVEPEPVVPDVVEVVPTVVVPPADPEPSTTPDGVSTEGASA